MKNCDPTHPGEYLRDELEEREWTVEEFATATGLPSQQVEAIVAGNQGIDADSAERIAAACRTSAGLWMNLQQAWDERAA